MLHYLKKINIVKLRIAFHSIPVILAAFNLNNFFIINLFNVMDGQCFSVIFVFYHSSAALTVGVVAERERSFVVGQHDEMRSACRQLNNICGFRTSQR